jgi:hypothetical protein
MFCEFADVFRTALPKEPARLEPMKIDLIKPLNELPKPRNNSQQKPAFWDIVHEKVTDMSNAGIIQASVSSFCSPIVLAFQKNKHRFCIDYRILNKFTVKFCRNPTGTRG